MPNKKYEKLNKRQMILLNDAHNIFYKTTKIKISPMIDFAIKRIILNN